MINTTIQKYKNGDIDAKEYRKKMFEIYERLLEYCDLLKFSKVEKLEIEKDKVIININRNDKNIKMLLHHLDSGAVPVTIMTFGEYEEEEMNMTLALLNMLGDDSVIFDIGANLGWYTLNIKKYMPKSKVYSFEPIEETYYKLKENLELNQIENENTFNFGFYNKNKKIEFFYDVIGSGASSIANLRELETTKKIQCNVKKMDDFIIENNIKRLDFIKCDVEGAELFVYEGGINAINELKPIVFSEMLRKWSAKLGYHPNDIICLFKKIGYECFVIDGAKLKKIEFVDENTVETNYFFMHMNKHAYIIKELL